LQIFSFLPEDGSVVPAIFLPWANMKARAACTYCGLNFSYIFPQFLSEIDEYVWGNQRTNNLNEV
jgi:transcription elongation factor Elf1